MHGFHPNLGMIGCQVLSFEPLDGGVSRTWTDANWIWHSLTNSGTIYDWCQIDTEIWVGSDYNYWPILGFGISTTNCQSMCGTPRPCHKGKRLNTSPQQSKGMCNKELGRYEHVQELHNLPPKANPTFSTHFASTHLPRVSQVWKLSTFICTSVVGLASTFEHA